MILLQQNSMLIHQMRLITATPRERCMYLLALHEHHIPNMIDNISSDSDWEQLISLWDCAELMGEA